MPELNENVPEFEVFLRKEYLYDLKKGFGEFEKAVIFGVSSIAGRSISFHCLTQRGAVIWRLPISAFCWKKTPPQELDILELWDCFSENITVTEFDFLSEAKVRTILRDGKWYEGEYVFTLDWYGSSAADGAGEIGHKCAHFIKLANGSFCAQPNNRILWTEQAFISEPFKKRPDYKTQTKTFKVENGRKWLTSKSDRMFYEVTKSIEKQRNSMYTSPKSKKAGIK